MAAVDQITAPKSAFNPLDLATGIRAKFARYRLYRQTLNELGQLSGRELADLGLSRSMLKGIALEAAYGAK